MVKIFFLLVIILGSLLLVGCTRQDESNMSSLKIGGVILSAEVVNTQEKITAGLSGRSGICHYCGMLFEFSDYQIRNFWMKEMKFPLDIIWLQDKQIVGLEKNVPVFTASGEISQVQSPAAVNRVLEINSGFIDHHQIKVGDSIEILD